jgi:hypothetical protein
MQRAGLRSAGGRAGTSTLSWQVCSLTTVLNWSVVLQGGTALKMLITTWRKSSSVCRAHTSLVSRSCLPARTRDWVTQKSQSTTCERRTLGLMPAAGPIRSSIKPWWSRTQFTVCPNAWRTLAVRSRMPRRRRA